MPQTISAASSELARGLTGDISFCPGICACRSGHCINFPVPGCPIHGGNNRFYIAQLYIKQKCDRFQVSTDMSAILVKQDVFHKMVHIFL
jgi:hypothetical protein